MAELSPIQCKFDLIEWEDFGERCTQRLQHAAKLKITHLPQLEAHAGTCAIVGAGPSVASQLDQIKEIKHGICNSVFSVNGAHDWLIKNDCIPNIHVLFEDDLEDVRTALGGEPHPEVTYYICSHCAPSIFEQLDNHFCVLWHAFLPPQQYQEVIDKCFPGEFMVGAGHTTLFRAIAIATILGYREFDLFGVDCSFDGSSHVDGYGTADKEPRIGIWGKDLRNGELKKFTSQGGLVIQASQFLEFLAKNEDLSMRIHGNGFLRFLHESRYPDQYLTTKGS